MVDSPCHKAKLSIKKKTPGAADETIDVPDGSSRISLEVRNTSRKKIKTYEGLTTYDRASGAGDPNDFRWFIDIENDLHPDKEYTTKEGKVKPIFRVNNALFYTEKRFENNVELKLGPAAKKKFGKLADEIAANIDLDTPTSEAVLTVDGDVKMTATAAEAKNGIRYIISFDCHCGPPLDPQESSDFNTFYQALEPDTPESEQAVLTRELPEDEDIHPVNSQVGCTGGGLPRLSNL